MGNRSSTPSSSSTEGQEGEGGGSGLYLTPELQAKINQDFDSHILQTEWSKYRTLHLQRHEQRENSYSIREEETQQKIEAFTVQAKQVHNQLDEMVDAAKSKLVDLEVEIEHDVNRLGKKFEGSLSNTAMTTEGICLDVRAELSHCYHTLKDSGECQIFAQKLDKCVTEALASS
mmetsp:Transcript_20739/g.45007  ORF Transcript_20739/g.45007 Transcript_20739/m.45007 type:complete len:174 (+) Transcript_20739:63-584(+)|eukprot:CAMPEP_0172308522 /NCGR_PEP_ID=MMETSP1058-20130122/9089_1 /TAXON_ID=83371 /ORGANISM="Detonula confervacea, Strain CCMP 353" /LENGTH=173 /DNA_ID=CAMNT_0013020957 /DNA_START=63 /DNA_END=584 /DNA_ORIENTATION=-